MAYNTDPNDADSDEDDILDGEEVIEGSDGYITDPTDPPPPPPQGKKDSDGFPAQALQVYWILKNQGYTDDNILLMLYYKGDLDGIIDINKFDAIPNDLNGAVIDIANDSVKAARFKQELDVSVSGSFASGLHAEDQLIIFMN